MTRKEAEKLRKRIIDDLPDEVAFDFLTLNRLVKMGFTMDEQEDWFKYIQNMKGQNDAIGPIFNVCLW